PGIVLGSAVAAFQQPFFGILPLRDDPDPGVEVRFVYPKSPAEKAGIKEGDRIMKLGAVGLPGVAPLPGGPGRPGKPRKGPELPMIPITRGREQLLSLIETARPGLDIRVEVRRKGTKKTETLTLKLGDMPDSVPEKLPETASAKKA